MSMLECTALSKNYGSVEALRSIDLTLESGRIVGLVGPNGSGKTTLIKLAQHLLTPTSGMITIDGMIPGPQTKAIVSYLPDRDFLPQWMNLDGKRQTCSTRSAYQGDSLWERCPRAHGKRSSLSSL